MNITIEVAGYYDWEPTEDKPDEEEILAMKYKPTAEGKLAKRVLIKKPSETNIEIPEEQIESLMEHFERVGAPKNRARTVMWFLEEKVMIHHAPIELWGKIIVHNDKAVDAYLNNMVGVESETDD